MAAVLVFEFLGPKDMAVGYFELFEGHSHAGGNFSDNETFVDVTAMAPGVAIQENIPGDHLSIDTSEEVNAKPAPPRGRACREGSADPGARANGIRAEILWESVSKPELPACIERGLDIAQSGSDMREAVRSEPVRVCPLPEPVFALPSQSKGGFIVELAVPPTGEVQSAETVNGVLGLFPKGRRPHDADDRFEGVQLRSRFAVQGQATVEKAGIGPLVGVDYCGANIRRGVDMLPQKKAHIVGAVRDVHKRSTTDDRQGPLRQADIVTVAFEVRGNPCQLDSVGVVFICVGKEVVFKKETHSLPVL